MAQPPGDKKLWPRLLLVGLTGALPLFVVSLLLIQTTYSSAIDFGMQEQRGLLFHRRLERVLEAVAEYAAASGRPAPGQPDMARARGDVQSALQALAADYRGELGRKLAFEPSALNSRGRQAALLTSLEDSWRSLAQAAPGSVQAADGAKAVVASVRAMIEHNADSSNLILDTDLDSYYLMDMLVVALPQSHERVLTIESLLARSGSAKPRLARDVAISGALFREADLARLQRDASSALREDALFHGVSESLQANLPPAVAAYVSAVERLARLLDEAETAEVPGDELAAATGAVRGAGANLFRVGAGELDRLLESRLSVIRGQRTRAYSVICGTLVAAAFVMGVLIRSLLAARYAEVVKSQEELRAKEAQLRALGDNLPGGMTYQVVRERDGSMRFLYVSAGVETLHGVSAEAVLADPAALYGLLMAEDLPNLEAAERESLASMTPFTAIARSRRKTDGSVRWMEFASAPRRLPDGRVIWDGIQMDITDRHLAESASRQMQQRFSHIFDASPISITLSSFSDGRFVAVNDKFLKVSGFTREEALGRTTAELDVYQNPEQRLAVFAELRAHGRLHGYEIQFKAKNGQVQDNLLWVEVITIEQEQYVLAMSLDVTEQKASARQQRALEEQLRQAQKLDALGTLAGGIAHDFNNILGAIISFSELSKFDNPNNELLSQNLDQILTASQRAAVLVRQILSFSRHQKEERRQLQIAPIVSEALSLLRATLPATIAIQQALAEGVPDVLANATQLHQIVMNLCTNAAHAMKGQHGKIRVELSEVAFEENEATPHVELSAGRYVRLTISDSGHGMDAVTRGRIFEPFFTTKVAGEGTGLGLSVVHGIVKEYRGVVTVESELGRGTTFAIYLPAASGATATAASDTGDVPRGNGERVLYVDDEVALGSAAEKMLERLGYQPVVFHSALAALVAFRQAPSQYRALVTDFTMPELTGIDLIRAIRRVRADLPVILVTGSGGDVAREELGTLGGRELLSKPLSYATLAAALRRVLAS